MFVNKNASHNAAYSRTSPPCNSLPILTCRLYDVCRCKRSMCQQCVILHNAHDGGSMARQRTVYVFCDCGRCGKRIETDAAKRREGQTYCTCRSPQTRCGARFTFTRRLSLRCETRLRAPAHAFARRTINYGEPSSLSVKLLPLHQHLPRRMTLLSSARIYLHPLAVGTQSLL